MWSHGRGDDEMKLRVKSKAHGYRKNLLFTAMAVFALLVQPMYALVAEQVANAASVTDWTSLTSELNGSDSVIDITGIVEVPANETVTVNRNVTINGGTLKAIGAGESGVTDAVVYVTGGATLTMNNTVVDGNNQTQRQGIKVYSGSHVVLNGVTIQNNKKTGLHVNGTSTAIVTGITTENNGASYGGMAVSGGGKITIDGQSHHTNEGYGLYDVRIDGSGTITDNKNQYKTTGQYYKLKSAPVAPVFISPTPSEGSTVASTSATVKWSPSATSSSRLDVVRYDVTLSGPGGVQVVPGVPAGGSLELTFDDLVDGAYTATVTAIGTFGESSNPVATRNFTVHVPDTTAPDAPVLNNSPVYVGIAQTTGVPATWTHSGTDVAYYEYREYRTKALADADVNADINGEAGAYWVPDRTSTDANNKSQAVGHSWKTSVNLYYRVVAVDALGNRSAPSEVGVAFVDKVAPEIEILNMNATNPTSFDIKATDTVGLKRIDYSLWTDNNTRQLGVWGEWISGVEFTNNDNSITQYTSNVDPYSKLNFADLPEGEYTLRATAGDAAGNSKNATNFNFTVKTPTVVTPTDPEAPEPETPPVINPPSSSGESPDLTTGRFTPSNQTIAPLTATSPIPGITGAPYASTILNGQDSTASNDSSVLASEDNKLKNSDKDSDVLATNDAKDSDNKDGWSVINVVLAGLTAILSVIALIGIASKEDGKRIGARLATVVIAVGVIILVFFTENFSQPMIWLNWWTVLYAVLLAIQAMVKPSSHKDLQ